MSRGRWGYGRYESYWPPYVPVAERRAKATAQLAKLQKKGEALEPVVLCGGRLASTFWGKAWCDNLLRYSDYSNRMPRGRSYVRNGHVLDLRIAEGKVSARVAGTRLYTIEIGIKRVASPRWREICSRCAGGIDSLVSLLQGKLSPAVMEVITRPGAGLFPEPGEISLSCSCPDWASMCKHVAAALYGVGARLDERPELLFLLRGVDHLELIGEAIAAPLPAAGSTARVLAPTDLSGIFGIDVEAPATAAVRALRARAAKGVRAAAAAAAAGDVAAAPRVGPVFKAAARAAAKREPARAGGAARGAAKPAVWESPVVRAARAVVEAARAAGKGTRAPGKAKRVPAKAARAPAKAPGLSAVRRLQGEYIDLLRSFLTAGMRNRMKGLAVRDGLAAAVAEMKRLLGRS